MPRIKHSPLFLGIRGTVVAIDPSNGAELWRTKLKTSAFMTLCQHEGQLFVGAAGELFCIDTKNGAVRWNNKLKGLGTGLIAFGTHADTSSAAAAQAAQAAAIAAVAAAT
jgi:outer membrane protein assembly factor BamB